MNLLRNFQENTLKKCCCYIKINNIDISTLQTAITEVKIPRIVRRVLSRRPVVTG